MFRHSTSNLTLTLMSTPNTRNTKLCASEFKTCKIKKKTNSSLLLTANRAPVIHGPAYIYAQLGLLSTFRLTIEDPDDNANVDGVSGIGLPSGFTIAKIGDLIGDTFWTPTSLDSVRLRYEHEC